MLEYTLAIQETIEMHQLCKGSLASLPFLGIGIMSIIPEEKHRLKKWCKHADFSNFRLELPSAIF